MAPLNTWWCSVRVTPEHLQPLLEAQRSVGQADGATCHSRGDWKFYHAEFLKRSVAPTDALGEEEAGEGGNIDSSASLLKRDVSPVPVVVHVELGEALGETPIGMHETLSDSGKSPSPSAASTSISRSNVQ